MVGVKKLKSLQMETIQDYFEYIIESKINGQKEQAKMLFKDLSLKQSLEFSRHAKKDADINTNAW
jgi:hypothetical protein